MKLLPVALAFIVGAPTAAFAGYGQTGFSRQCFREVYREEYVPGTVNNPGSVRRWTETVEVPCGNSTAHVEILEDPFPINHHPQHTHRTTHVDDNSCIEGAIIGGIAGGAGGGVLATQENWIWSIPTGIIGGALIGCQVDGG